MDTIENKNYKYWFLPDYDLLKKENSMEEKTNICCSCIEQTLHLCGIVATALYRDSGYNNTAMNHTLFMSFEKGFFGSWLYLARKTGELFYYDNYTREDFCEWLIFYKKLAYDLDLVNIASDLLRFRNEVRHGSMTYNRQSLNNKIDSLDNFLENLNFIKDYEVAVKYNEKNYVIGENGCIETNTNAGNTVLRDKKQNTAILLSEFVSFDVLKQSLLLLNVTKKKDPFYEKFGLKQHYQNYKEEKNGHLKLPEQQEQAHFTSPIFGRIFDQINESQKMLLVGAPGKGKTYLVKYLHSLNIDICCFFVEESPLRIKPLIALKAFCSFFEHLVSIETNNNIKNIDESLERLRYIATKFPERKFIIVVDGLFSAFIKDFFDKKWWDILSGHFPNNLIWVVTAATMEGIPHFYDTSIPIPSIDENAFAEHFTTCDSNKVLSYSVGNPLFIWDYEKNKGDTCDTDLYWHRYFETLQIREEWQKKVLLILAEEAEFITFKEVAQRCHVFTPKVEKFLHDISVLLKKNEKGYTIYHPLLTNYIRRKI